MSNSNLHQLVDSGNFDAFKRLVDLDVNLIDSIDEYGRTPLILCSAKKTDNHFKITRYLLDCGCDVNIQANYKYNNWTALMTACYFGNFRAIELIMSANPNLELQDIASNTAWQIAFDNSYRDCVNFILAEMEEKRIESRLELEKELQDAVFNNDIDNVKECMKKIDPVNLKQVINTTTSGNHTLLYRACRNGNAQIVRLLLENGAIARPHYYTKYSPLYIACHMGNVEIAKIILEKFPHLIQVSTIEKFLPFHAACSQGHLDVLKLLIEHRSPSLDQVYYDARGNRYASTFDVNACDVNEQSGLFAAVLANRLDVVRYLLDIKLRKLTDAECERIETRRKRFLSRQQANSSQSSTSNATTSNLISSKSVPVDLVTQNQGHSASFFDHLKSVFLDTKSYDPYVVNYTSTPVNDEEEPSKQKAEQTVEGESSSATKKVPQQQQQQLEVIEDDDVIEQAEYFNPFNIDSYSKFGTTCLHEAIRSRNAEMVELLLSRGADSNQQVFEFSSTSASSPQQQQPKPISNCLCESIRLKPTDDEKLFNMLIKTFKYNEFDFKMTLKFLYEQKEPKLIQKYIPALLAQKIGEDSENRINARNKISNKLLNVHGFAAGHDSPGLILSWASLEPKLDRIYESYFLNAIKQFKSAQVALSKSSEELSFKKLHIYAISRIDLSSNAIDCVPFCIFQMESLRVLKLSNNSIKTLPLSRNAELDDLGPKSDRFSKTSSWSCHVLEELDIENNQLTELPSCLFHLKALKHLNVANNNIDRLPVEMWQAPSLFDLNAAHNKLTHLPIIDVCSLRECLCGEERPRAISNPTERFIGASRSRRGDERPPRQQQQQQQTKKPSIQPTTDHPLKPSPDKKFPTLKPSPAPISSFKLKEVEKVNFWSLHSASTNLNRAIGVGIDFDDLDTTTTTNTIRTGGLLSLSHQGNNPAAIVSKESKLIELNLSNNRFNKIPECLSCLAPKLVKLNLSSNRIESMGAVCDLPSSLKFLDLSNNRIRRSMRLLNENLLKFILFYFSKMNSSSTTGEEFNINNLLVNLLLENEFCYLNLIKKTLNAANNNQNSSSSSYTIPMSDILPNQQYHTPVISGARVVDQSKFRLREKSIRPSNVSASSGDANNSRGRRTRSHSRNYRAILSNGGGENGAGSDAENKRLSTPGVPPGAKRVLPFDLFLINLRYNRAYSSAASLSQGDEEKSNFEISKIIDEFLTSADENVTELLDKQERVILNSQNIQIFLEQLCPHKRHIKLENLKSINLNNNRVKRFDFMFDLSLTKVIPSVEPTAASSGNASGGVPKSKSTPKIDSNSENSSEMSDESSGVEEDVEEAEETESTPKGSKEPKSRLKSKLAQLSPLKKRSEDSSPKTPSRSKRISSTSSGQVSSSMAKTPEERAAQQAKLMFPNLTHLDLSFNKLTRLPSHLAYLDNLSYLNASSNPSLVRVSPKLGLLNKLWNFDLKNCPNLREPVMLDALVKQKTKTSDILGYLKSILEHSRPYTRMKLMFVGVQAIGKTSLLNRLREEGTTNSINRHSWTERTTSQSSAPSQTNISTVGIDINEWIYDKPRPKSSAHQSSSTNELKNTSLSSSPGGNSSIHSSNSNTSMSANNPYLYIYQQLENSMSSTAVSAMSKYFGPITFRTWDFAGQREYYTTHQYFISRRAIYLVCWKLSEEEKGIDEIHQWLSNIQTRAPGSPVIIVGTHHDQIAKLKNYKEISNYLQRLIYDRFVRPSAETESTSAYPPIMASIEISSKTGHNVKMLARLIYDVATQMKTPGFKDQLLLEQKVPVTYLALEECVYYVLNKLRSQSRNPILTTNNYLKEIRSAIEILYPTTGESEKQEETTTSSKLIGILSPTVAASNSSSSKKKGSDSSKSSASLKRVLIRFRDDTEILQASQFLHENGILIHYNDVALSDIYFLDPQWLCDILATVVTIREINPFAAKGIMKINDLLVLFKGSRFAAESDEIMTFIVDLLGKFELALTWDNEHLLIPSLLPTEAMLQFTNQDIRISIVSKQKALADRNVSLSFVNMLQPSNSSYFASSSSSPPPSLSPPRSAGPTGTVSQKEEITSLYSNVRLANSYAQSHLAAKLKLEFKYECRRVTTPETDCESVRRLYCLNYLPSGFFSRLITRILGDNILKECLLELIELEVCSNFEDMASLIDFVCQEAEWRCWQTGVELRYLDYTLMRVKEILVDPIGDQLTLGGGVNKRRSQIDSIFAHHPVLYRDCENEFKCKSVSKQCAFVECYASHKTFEIVKANEVANEPLVRILCNRKVCIRIYALIIEIIDTLLEDWYPDLGTRFMQDSKGDYLVTRLAPCALCVKTAKAKFANNASARKMEKEDSQFELVASPELFVDPFSLSASEQNLSSLASTSAITSSPGGQQQQIIPSHRGCYITDPEDQSKLAAFDSLDWLYCFMLDDLCYSVLKQSRQPTLLCARHGEQSARTIAPDLAFDDIDSALLIADAASALVIESLLGRGSFGSVFRGLLGPHKVAVKVLENLKTAPTALSVPAADSSQQQSHEERSLSSAKSWTYRKSIRLAAKAYTIARQEIAIVSSLRHENIVAMIGLSIQPLAIILELAPLGNLKDILGEYKQNMCKLNAVIIQAVAVQVSSAIVYLHTNRIIYRDLKADNVLVWQFPRPNHQIQQQKASAAQVLLKLADYSISRCVLPTGTKGFAGTPGFMAPEILKYNGEETYSEKVDCFSFGMFLYELLTLKLPFEGQEQLKDIILNGGRPLIRAVDLEYPTLALDLMCLCWSDSPSDRPSAANIYKYANSYEFSHLMDVCILDEYERAAPLLVATTLNREYEVNEENEQEAAANEEDDDDAFGMGAMRLDEADDYDEDEIEEEDLIDVWVVRNCIDEGASQLEVLTYESRLNCAARKQINVCNERIEALCVYNGNQLWCVDASKSIFVYCSRTYKKLNQFIVNVPDRKPEIISMYPMENVSQILLCNANGLLILIKVDSFHTLSTRNNKIETAAFANPFDADISYFLIDLSIKVNTSVLLPSRYDINYDIWLGSENTEIFCFSLKSMRLTGSYLHTSSHHFLTNSLLSNRNSAYGSACVDLGMSSSSPDMVTVSDATVPHDVTLIKTTLTDSFFLWSYVYPGSTVYLWNHVSKKIMSSYNCLKAYDDLNFKTQSNREFKIIDMIFLNGNLYCGTSSGTVLVLKRLTLTPLLIFQAHMHQLYRLCPLTFETRVTTIEHHYQPSAMRSVATTGNLRRFPIAPLPPQQAAQSTTTVVVKRTQHLLLTLGRALAPAHEDIYLSSSKYRVEALSKYANCLILCNWNSALND